jgi:hypothetical protein
MQDHALAGDCRTALHNIAYTTFFGFWQNRKLRLRDIRGVPDSLVPGNDLYNTICDGLQRVATSRYTVRAILAFGAATKTPRK